MRRKQPNATCRRLQSGPQTVATSCLDVTVVLVVDRKYLGLHELASPFEQLSPVPQSVPPLTDRQPTEPKRSRPCEEDFRAPRPVLRCLRVGQHHRTPNRVSHGRALEPGTRPAPRTSSPRPASTRTRCAHCPGLSANT